MLKYKVIKSQAQYRAYCKQLEELVDASLDQAGRDEIELLTVLIEKWDREQTSMRSLQPVPLLCTLMNEHGIRAVDLATRLKMSKGYVSDILNYKKSLSKQVIRELAMYFRVSQEAFNRPYSLKASANVRSRSGNASRKSHRKSSV